MIVNFFRFLFFLRLVTGFPKGFLTNILTTGRDEVPVYYGGDIDMNSSDVRMITSNLFLVDVKTLRRSSDTTIDFVVFTKLLVETSGHTSPS